MRLSLFSRLCFSGLTLCAVGCTARFDPANFDGSREPRRAEPEAVSDVAVRTADMERLGSVSAACRSQPGFHRLEGELLSDLDCTPERLLWALRESAASAGGELLVGARCSSLRINAASPDARELRCGGD